MSDRPPRKDIPPEIFGPYLVYERLGVGGMATVHRAKERGIEGFERQVALKRLLPHLAEDEQFVRAFVREAKLASMLTHTNIVQLFELGRVDHVYFISMELIEGRDIRKLLRQARRITGPPPTDVVVSLLIEICDALDYAHTRCDDNGDPLGLVHRDVSPSNIIVTRGGHVKIIDFGIAKANTIHMRTATGRVKGKMAYMAPEATRGETLDARSDIFSAGVVAHELLTARPLFATKNDYQTLMRVQNAPVAPPSTYNQSCSPELDAIVLKALAKSPDERFESAAAMRDALDLLRQQQQINATSREVSDWIDWAFALEEPAAGARTRARVTPPSLSAITGSKSGISGSGMYTPPTGSMDFYSGESIPPLEADDEVIEIAWGGRDEGAPVLLDDVPDRSGPMLFEDEDVGETPAPMMSMNPAAAKSGGTLLTYVPPPPKRATTARGKDVERKIAAGTSPPATASAGLDTAVPLPAPDTDVLADFEAQLRDELSGPHATPQAEGTPARRARPQPQLARASTPGLPIDELVPATKAEPIEAKPAAPIPVGRPRRKRALTNGSGTTTRGKPAPRKQRASRATTEFGAHIVERERGNWVRGLIGAVLILAIAAGAFLLTRGSKGHKAAAADADNATLKVVVEPKDATIEIKGQGTYEKTPLRVELPAKSYSIEIRRDGYKTWSSAITMEKNETQTLRVVLAHAGTSEAAQAVKTREPKAVSESAGKIADDDDDEAAKERRRKRRRAREKAQIADDDSREEDSTAATQALPGSVSLTPLSVKGDEPPRARKTGPHIVPPNAVRKRRGSPPHIHIRPGEDPPPERVSARLCIDRRGKVSSAKVVTSVSSRVRDIVEKVLKRWRYAPYRHKGERVKACFVVTFRTR